MGDVHYGIMQVEESIPGGLRGSHSPLNDMVEEIRKDERLWKQGVLIARYAQKTAAGAAANVMRQRFGRNISVQGFVFASRKLNDEETGLWVYYDPEQVVDGEWDKHVKAEKKRKDKLAAEAKARKEKETTNASAA